LLRDPKWHSSAIEDFKKIETESSEALFMRKAIVEEERLMEDIPF
jgi:hypothetical protein